MNFVFCIVLKICIHVFNKYMYSVHVILYLKVNNLLHCVFPLSFVYSMNEMLFALHIEGVRFQYQSYSGRQEVLMVLARIPPRVKGHDSGGCIWCTLIITDVILSFITCEMGNTKKHEIYTFCANAGI